MEEGWVDENHIDSSKPYEGESSQSIDDKAARVVPLGSSDSPDSEAKTKHDDAFVSVDVSAPHKSIGTMDDTTVTGDTESQDGEDGMRPLPSQEGTPDTSSIPARGDQVTDVGWALILFMLIVNQYFPFPFIREVYLADWDKVMCGFDV